MDSRSLGRRLSLHRRAIPGARPTHHQVEGIAQLKQGHVQEALTEFRAAVAAYPADAVSHDYIGVILAESGQLDQALAEFDQAARLQPVLPDPHFHLGLAYERTGGLVRPSPNITRPCALIRRCSKPATA